MLHQFKILFFLYKSKINPKGYSPIFCRITFNNRRKQFSIGSQVKEQNWNSKTQRYKGSAKEAVLINDRVENIREKVISAYNQHGEINGCRKWCNFFWKGSEVDCDLMIDFFQ